LTVFCFKGWCSINENMSSVICIVMQKKASSGGRPLNMQFGEWIVIVWDIRCPDSLFCSHFDGEKPPKMLL
jgi:hypothetical protein